MLRIGRLLRPALLSLAALAGLGAVPSVAAAGEDTPEYAARHILVSWDGLFDGRGEPLAKVKRTQAEAKALAEKALEELKKPGASFAAVSHKYSDDTMSDERGGFLGLFGKQGMTPPFERAVVELKDGQLSGVVETSFGYHLIERLSIPDALRMITTNNAFVMGAVFPYAGLELWPKTPRAKDKALADAKRAAELLRAGAPFNTLPKDLAAESLNVVMSPRPERTPPWVVSKIEKGGIRKEFGAILDTAFALESGKVSEPLDTPAGYVVLRSVPYFHGYFAHLLVMHSKSFRCPPGVTRTREEAKARAEEALKKIKADPASWAKVVAETTDDPKNRDTGGDLSFLETGNMAGEFDEGIAGLKPGEISGVFESRFGFHIVRKLD